MYPFAAATSSVAATTKAGSWTTDGVAGAAEVEVGQAGRRPTPQRADEMTDGNPPLPPVALAEIGKPVTEEGQAGRSPTPQRTDEIAEGSPLPPLVTLAEIGKPVGEDGHAGRSPTPQRTDETTGGTPPLAPGALVAIGITGVVGMTGPVVVDVGQFRPVRKPIEQSTLPMPPEALEVIGITGTVGMIGGIPIWRLSIPTDIDTLVGSGRERLNEGGLTLACG